MTGLAAIYIYRLYRGHSISCQTTCTLHVSSTSPPDNFRMWGKWIYRIIVLIQKVFSVKYVLRTRPHAAATNRSPFGSFAVWQWTKLNRLASLHRGYLAGFLYRLQVLDICWIASLCAAKCQPQYIMYLPGAVPKQPSRLGL